MQPRGGRTWLHDRPVDRMHCSNVPLRLSSSCRGGPCRGAALSPGEPASTLPLFARPGPVPAASAADTMATLAVVATAIRSDHKAMVESLTSHLITPARRKAESFARREPKKDARIDNPEPNRPLPCLRSRDLKAQRVAHGGRRPALIEIKLTYWELFAAAHAGAVAGPARYRLRSIAAKLAVAQPRPAAPPLGHHAPAARLPAGGSPNRRSRPRGSCG